MTASGVLSSLSCLTTCLMYVPRVTGHQDVLDGHFQSPPWAACTTNRSKVFGATVRPSGLNAYPKKSNPRSMFPMNVLSGCFANPNPVRT